VRVDARVVVHEPAGELRHQVGAGVGSPSAGRNGPATRSAAAERGDGRGDGQEGEGGELDGRTLAVELSADPAA